MTFVKLVRMGAGCQKNQPPEWRAGNLSPSPTAPRTGGHEACSVTDLGAQLRSIEIHEGNWSSETVI